jgi:hypothetical protein
MDLGIEGMRNSLVSHALESGLFERVDGHEPANAPGNGLTCSVVLNTIGPARSSGLASTSALVTFRVRVMTNMLTSPVDRIDPLIGEATSALFAAYSGDFTLGDQARCIDLLGQSGTPLSAKTGYLPIGNKEMRLMDTTVPVIVNDAWEQAS